MARTPDSTRRSERSRSAILSATRELIGEVAYAKLTIEAIAARAGVGKQTIYRWWPSKGAVVFDAILAQSADAEGVIELPDTGDIAADLKTVLRATVAEFADPAFDAPIRAVLTEVINDPGLAAQYREQLEQPVHAAKVRRLAKAQHAGQIRADADLDLLVDLLYGPITQRWLPRSGPLDEAFADALVDSVLRAFAPTG
ncbi:TetR/AcrR family transcriptional regulator [Nocardia neocaledoniensis]|uniref:TetR/AcrR family transcriptional regulator n=1 Tax=Nocardia neocaledoniensis TaxID=236511 RepID=UPI002458F22E|nr:TetR/AcrR family transcriptional regulator [Nocardia neocaledoniensis]